MTQAAGKLRRLIKVQAQKVERAESIQGSAPRLKKVCQADKPSTLKWPCGGSG